MKAEFGTSIQDRISQFNEIFEDQSIQTYKKNIEKEEKEYNKKQAKNAQKKKTEWDLSDVASWIDGANGDKPLEGLIASEGLLQNHHKRHITVYATEQQWFQLFHWDFRYTEAAIKHLKSFLEKIYKEKCTYEKYLESTPFPRNFEQKNPWIDWIDEATELFTNVKHLKNSSVDFGVCVQRMQGCDYRELWIMEQLLKPIDTPKEILKFLQEFRLRQFTLNEFNSLSSRNACLRDKLEMKFQFLSSYAEVMLWMTQKMNETEDDFRKKINDTRNEMISKVQLVLNVNEFGEILLQDDFVEHDSIKKKKSEVFDRYREFGRI